LTGRQTDKQSAVMARKVWWRRDEIEPDKRRRHSRDPRRSRVCFVSRRTGTKIADDPSGGGGCGGMARRGRIDVVT